MPFCPNPNCDHRQRVGEPAEFSTGIQTCSDCGSTLSETAPHFSAVIEPKNVVQMNVAHWTCPQCSAINREDLSLCSCGYDSNRPMMSDIPAYAKYTLDELYDVYDHVDKERYPGRFNLIVKEIEKRKSNPTPAVGETTIAEKPRELVLKFRGSATEYFRIWIVNLCLTIMTAGFFSAWAKVRKKRYFYSQTTLDGTPFQYLGQPIPILKGRMIAAVAFCIYYVSSHFFTSLLPYVLAVGAVLAPWVFVRSAAFNARYSAYRNMTFHFDGRYLGAVKVLSWGALPLVTFGLPFKPGVKYAVFVLAAMVLFGLAFPWWMKRLKNFLVSHTSYGNKNGIFSATGGQFFEIYFKSGLVMVAAGILFGIIAAMLFKSSQQSQIFILLASIPLYTGYVLAYAYAQAQSGNLVWNHTGLGPLRFQSTLRGRGLAKLYVTNALAIIASLGLMIPWAVMRTLRYRADNMRVLQKGELVEFQGSDASAVGAVGAETVDFFDLDISL